MYVYTAWNARSETSYTFGPFATPEDCDAWLRHHPECDINNGGGYDEGMIVYVNKPATVGTGQEESMIRFRTGMSVAGMDLSGIPQRGL